FCEYGIFMPPLADGPASVLSGINVAYDRETLLGCRPVWQEAFYENEVHDALRRRGHRLHRVARAWVRSHLVMGLREAMAHLATGGRRFGSHRRQQAPAAVRGLWALAGPAVPAVLLGRIVRRVAGRRPAWVVTLARGLPYVLCLLAAWSAGEVR